MRNPSYSTVNLENGNVNYRGPSEQMPGNHNHMTNRTEAYRPTDDKGHVQASSMGGVNSKANVVPQDHDVNHGGYKSMEDGARTALQNGATIESDKTAYVDDQPGARPHTFESNDEVTYKDGHTEHVNLSFTNESYADQEAWNAQSAALPGTFDAPNPGDSLRASMSSAEYSELMEETDAALPNIADEYTPSDFSGVPASGALDAEMTAEDDATVDAGDDGVSPDDD